MSAPSAASRTASLRRRCRGELPLSARLEPWQVELCGRPGALEALLAEHGSPLNLIDPSPMGGNAAELSAAARAAGVPLGIFFARKANKALALVDEARRLGLGIDVASERELAQALDRGVDPAAIVVTAAVKPEPLLRLCLERGATIVIDNLDELELLIALAEPDRPRAPLALRIGPFAEGARIPTRFGLRTDEVAVARERLRGAGLGVAGIHFHLDGYSIAERVAAIEQSLALVDELRSRGERPGFLDIGGGIPMSYLDRAAEWESFWEEHRLGVLGDREPLTFGGHGLGLLAHRGELIGRPNVYPYHQSPVRGEWLAELLARELEREGRSVAAAITERGLELRCEPGRSLLDGCGITAARVMFRKRRADGTGLVGLAMNRTQCRSTSDDFLVDPLLVGGGERPPGEPFDGYLVGAYCIERELLSWRRLAFPEGVEVGDVVVFPNTAGYLMHILESASHQIPLARNVIVGPGAPELDPIDQPPSSA